MANIPENLKYLASHEWVEVLDDGTARVGITDHAQALLGDMVFIDVPEVGRDLSAGEECAVVESVKAASDLYSPLSGEVIEINGDLDGCPDLINNHPYGDGWIYRLRLSDAPEVDELLSAEAYTELLVEEE